MTPIPIKSISVLGCNITESGKSSRGHEYLCKALYVMAIAVHDTNRDGISLGLINLQLLLRCGSAICHSSPRAQNGIFSLSWSPLRSLLTSLCLGRNQASVGFLLSFLYSSIQFKYTGTKYGFFRTKVHHNNTAVQYTRLHYVHIHNSKRCMYKCKINTQNHAYTGE